MQIPYAVAERPDTGLNNAKLGIWLFLGSEVMLFGALFSTYIFMRVLAPPDWYLWSLELNQWLAMLNTIILISSSVTMVMAWATLKMNRYGQHLVYLSLTFLLACGFLVVKYFEYTHKFHGTARFPDGIFPSTNNFFAIYYTMTGLHGLHVVAGMAVIAYLLLTGKRLFAREPDHFASRVEVTGLYWHFVDLVWIFLFPVFYLL